MKLQLSQIGVIPKYYPRVNGQADWLTVHRYTDALRANSKFDFPPVVVVKVVGLADFEYRYLLIDGAHRVRAYIAAGRDEIPVIVENIPRSTWFARSVELNSTHGRGLDTGDKAWIAERLTEEGYSEKQIAKLLFMTVESLQKIRITRVVKIHAAERKLIPEGRGNRKMERGAIGFLKAPLVNSTGSRPQLIAAIQSQGAVSSHDVADVLDSFIAVLRSGVVDMANTEVAAKISIIRELLACSV